MEFGSSTASLKGFGAPPTAATVVIERLSPRRRVARASAVAGMGVAAAAIALPIPLVHFVLVPASLLLGSILGAMRLAQREIFSLRGRSLPLLQYPAATRARRQILPPAAPSALHQLR